ncbi:hypothetical protein JMJ77_0000753 [Colletotrichum scovillei]|uniref:Uncharacterized protein n=1 Tax=Colletotrichum scovillei TaxID=1209932 RepID=A0A9P7RBP3_9PEZI|nr:hypothetical protein JMJ77_0000753 [Colletotrichum scovillei]KAG7080304.1 hypothetical protein JMJ78_0007401 [Colletotrichum scovillei]
MTRTSLILLFDQDRPENQESVDICRTGAGSTINIDGLKLINHLAMQFEEDFYISSGHLMLTADCQERE